VNHDLIAAGHPVLKFELAAYHELLPKHWRSSVEREGNAEFEVELWSAGQVTAADAALELLRWRAQNVADKHPDAAWPEFAEYDCFACHHDLEDPSWRRQRTLAGLPLGMPAWGTWSFGPLRQMYESDTDVGSSFKALGDHMHRGFGGNQQDVTTAVTAARNQLASLVKTESLAGLGKRMRTALRQLERVHQTADKTDNAQPRSWDEAVQLYLAIVAMDHAAEKIDSNTLATTRKLFSFPDEYDSPRGFFGERPPPTSETALRDASPRSRQQIVKALLDLIQQLETGN